MGLPLSPAPPISLHSPLVVASVLPHEIHHGSPQRPSLAPELSISYSLPQQPLSCPPLVPLPDILLLYLLSYSQGVITPLLWP